MLNKNEKILSRKIIWFALLHLSKPKVKVGNVQEMLQSERNSHSKTEVEKKNEINDHVLILRKHIVS